MCNFRSLFNRSVVTINDVIKIPFKNHKKYYLLKSKCIRNLINGYRAIVGNVLRIKGKAPPVGEAANKELIKILSKELHVRKIVIKIGHS